MEFLRRLICRGKNKNQTFLDELSIDLPTFDLENSTSSEYEPCLSYDE